MSVRWKEVDTFDIYCGSSMICAADGPHVGTKIEGEIQDDQGNQAL